MTSRFFRACPDAALSLALLSVLCLTGAGPVRAGTLPAHYERDLKRFAVSTDSVVNDYYSSGLVGNGLLGAAVYKQPGDTLCWELGRSDVYDHRYGEPYTNLYSRCRLPVGKFLLPMAGGSSSLTIDLYGAEVSGTIRRADGRPVKWRTWTPAEHNVYVIEWEGRDLPEITFEPELSASPRFTYPKPYYGDPALDRYKPNPAPLIYTKGEYLVCKQPMTAGGEYTTVWTTCSAGKNKRILLASVAYSQERTDTEKDAIRDIETVREETLGKARRMHLDWWHDFYGRSYISVGEEKYDRFFWMQLYKLGSATRSDGRPIDLMGPWFHNVTPWPAIWWNLNIQLTYSPMCVIGHSELSEPLLRLLDDHIGNLLKNVPPECPYLAIAIGRTSSYDCVGSVTKEHGLLLWTLYYYWEYCQYTRNDARMREKLFPLLKLAVNYYRWMLYEGEDGYLHLPESHSPEYADAEDCNFELALLRWGCDRLVEIDRRYGIGDGLLPLWELIRGKLVPYPQDEKEGMLIGRGVHLTSGHRHYSHLLMFSPLQTLSLNDPANRELANRSINHWLGFKNGYYVGYTYSGAASMVSLMGEGDRAYGYLNTYFDKFWKFNSLYAESGPCFETPMAVLKSYTEMLLASRGTEVRVFPAVPAAWPDIRFEGLRTQGGCEVGAVRTGGLTREVTVRSLYGGPCEVYTDIPSGILRIKASKRVKVSDGENGTVCLDIPKGETVVLVRGK